MLKPCRGHEDWIRKMKLLIRHTGRLTTFRFDTEGLNKISGPNNRGLVGRVFVSHSGSPDFDTSGLQYWLRFPRDFSRDWSLGKKEIWKVSKCAYADEWRKLAEYTKMRNEEVLKKVDKRIIMKTIKKKIKSNWLGHWLSRNCVLMGTIEGMIEREKRKRKKTNPTSWQF